MAGKKHALTPQVIVQLEKFVRAGCFPEVAAEAVGVPVSIFRGWLQRADRKPCPIRYVQLRDKVREAAAQARAAAEVTLFQGDHTCWLRQGPGKETATRPGWSSTPRAIYREEMAVADLSMEVLQLCGGIFEALKQHPEAHRDVIKALEAQDVRVPKGRR